VHQQVIVPLGFSNPLSPSANENEIIETIKPNQKDNDKKKIYSQSCRIFRVKLERLPVHD
jgi:hypothetical protein